ncbi:N-acetylneuraminate (7)9-O-acetyltransferase [Onthophagus taurus]|uniref:N-acetylneuraminate (7)9-O-acetyltransferase n=1 Tax=Onthophagus taurus TaxID=166361 RepID=UPI000C2068B5|nr:N-acetylneuraminate 9-O-acetyltransferase [Onthophagus taurus]
MVNERSSIERLIQQINAVNAKRLAVVLVITFACYHEFLHLKYGSNSCVWLLSDGRYKGDQEWQPYGCMLHHYTKIDTRRCLRYLAYYGKDTHFVFIGDSRIKSLYDGLIDHIKQYDATTEAGEPSKDATHIDDTLKIKVDYVWSKDVSKVMVDEFKRWQNDPKPPSVIIAGCGLWSIHKGNGSQLAVKEYASNLTRLVQPVDNLSQKKTTVLWSLQEPVAEEKLTGVYHGVMNEYIDLYNGAAIEVFTHSQVQLWWSAKLVGQGMTLESPDGVHLAAKPLQHNVQILLNMYCNDYMNFNDGTCCSSTESYTTLQIVTFSILGVCVIIAILMHIYRWLREVRGRPIQEYTLLAESETSIPPDVNDYYNLFKSLATMAIIMAYFIVCDRTNFFMKENKYYSEFSFWLPIGYVFTLGLFFTEDSKITKVLHRDQVNEWKGWMQLVILVYNVTGARRILPINMHIKVLMSAYIFILAYQQFCYVWQRADIGIVHFFRTLFELNFMTVTLCLCMNRPYQFYHLVPLMSFWYLMIYIVLALPPHITAQSSENNKIHYFYLVIKFITLFSVITILFLSEVFFEKVFVTRPWKALFVTTDDDIHEWWSRWKLDRYSTIYGMLFAVILYLAQRYNIYDDNNHNNLFSRGLALSTTLAGLIGLGSYITFTFLCRNELDCSEIHSYIVFLPIVSYIFLRNISGVLRTKYSSLFAWFGNISLELFISQYHIWLAADTHGVLVLIPGYPVLNIIVTSFIFVCASHEIHRITKILLPYAVPSEWKLVLRNFVLFLAILVPIGIHDGMF